LNEAVAAAMHGLDEPRDLRLVAQHLAQLLDANRGHRIADRDLRPHGVQQSLLGHKLTRVIDEIEQYVEGFAPQAYLLLASPKLSIHRVEAKRGEKKLPLVHVLPGKKPKTTSIA
jgi:hypothetical protein